MQKACPALISTEQAARVHARLIQNKLDNPGRNVDPLATLWRGLAVCGHCGRRMMTATATDGYGRRYYCRSRTSTNGGLPIACPGGAFSMAARVLDPLAWAAVPAWPSQKKNVHRALPEWPQ